MTLTILAALPIVGAIALALMPRLPAAKHVALLFALAAFAMSVVAFVRYDVDAGGYQLNEKHEWISAFGTWYALGIDGLGLTLIMLTTILTVVCVLAAYTDRLPNPKDVNAYFAWMLLLEGLALGVFSATDVFLFYILFEATLVPLYFLIGSFGGPRRSYAAVKFLIYNLAGGLLMLAAVVGLYVVAGQNGTPTFLLSELQGLDMGTTTERLLFCGFFIAFAVKAPLWPLHTWLPDATAAGTPATSVLLVSVIDKIGTFGMIRFCLGLFPGASEWASPVVVILAVVSILYGALLAVGQDDIRRLIAFVSVSHFGFIILGVFIFSKVAAVGSALYMFNHGLSTAALFLVTGMLIAKRGSARISDFGGAAQTAPIAAGIFLLAGLSSLSLPGLAPFVSEFMVLVGTFNVSIVLGVLATITIILAALYILWMFQRMMTGPRREDNRGVVELSGTQITALAPAVVLIVALGFFPQPLLNMLNPAMDSAMSQITQTEPEPRTVHADTRSSATGSSDSGSSDSGSSASRSAETGGQR